MAQRVKAVFGLRDLHGLGHRILEIPTFRMVPGAEIGILRHGALDSVGEPRRSALNATANWTKALDRLIENPTADLTDLIGM